MIYPIKTRYANLVGVSNGIMFWSPAPISFVNLHLPDDLWLAEDVSPSIVLTARVLKVLKKFASVSNVVLEDGYVVRIESSEKSPHALLTEVLRTIGHKGAVCSDDTAERALEVRRWFQVIMLGYDLHNLMCAAALTKNRDKPTGVIADVSWASLSTASVRDLCLSPVISHKYLTTIINKTLNQPGWWDLQSS